MGRRSCCRRHTQRRPRRGWAYLEKAVVVDHPILAVQEGEEGVLGVQQHLALTLLLGLGAFVVPVLQSEDLWGRRRRRKGQQEGAERERQRDRESFILWTSVTLVL